MKNLLRPKSPGLRRRKSLKGKLLSSIMLVSFAICIVFGGTGLFLLYRNSIGFMRDEVDASAKAYSMVVQNSLAKYISAVSGIADDPAIFDSGLSQGLIKQRTQWAAKADGFLSAQIADTSGKTLDGQDIKDTDYFTRAILGRFYLSTAYREGQDRSERVTMATPVSGSEFTGVLACSLSTVTMNKLVEEISIGKTGYGFLVDGTGTILADKTTDNTLNRVNYIEKAKADPAYSGMAGVVGQMIAGKTGGQQITFEGRKVYISYHPISNATGWSIAVVAVEDEMLAGMYSAVSVMLGLIAVFLLLAVLLSRRIALPLVRPILSLAGRISTLAEGDLHSEVPAVRTGDELQALSETFGSTLASLNGYIGEISTILTGLAAGDFTVRTEREYLGDFTAIRESLDIIVASMNRTFAEISRMADRVYGGSEQVAAGAQSLAQGATEQAGTMEQLSASLQEITRRVGENAEYTRKADSIAREARERVAQGSSLMRQMTAAMLKIEEASGKIGKIIKTIETISFQTNILALNAAVEAARAGEAGKGFSVVADEVRNLAGESSEAVKDTSALIRNSLEAVEEGRRIVDGAAEALGLIVEQVESMAGLFASISKSAAEEAASIDQINQGTKQISAVVQSTSATAEEGVATSEELHNLAQELRDMLAKLKLREAPGKEGQTHRR